MQYCKVITGFPGIGKSFIFKNTNLLASDSDSSEFSWVVNHGVKERNPDFPQNYIAHIRANLEVCDIIMVSTHDVVRKALDEAGIEFISVYPDKSLKEEYRQRYIDRGSPEALINYVMENWDNMMEDFERDITHQKVILQSGQYLSDVLTTIL